MSNEDKQKKKKADMTAISVVASGPFCMIVGLAVAGHWSDGNPFAIVLGMVVGFAFGLFMRRIFVNKEG